MKLTGVQSQAAELVDVLVRASDANRQSVLEWIGTLLASAELRAKQGYVAPEGSSCVLVWGADISATPTKRPKR